MDNNDDDYIFSYNLFNLMVNLLCFLERSNY